MSTRRIYSVQPIPLIAIVRSCSVAADSRPAFMCSADAWICLIFIAASRPGQHSLDRFLNRDRGGPMRAFHSAKPVALLQAHSLSASPSRRAQLWHKAQPAARSSRPTRSRNRRRRYQLRSHEHGMRRRRGYHHDERHRDRPQRGRRGHGLDLGRCVRPHPSGHHQFRCRRGK